MLDHGLWLARERAAYKKLVTDAGWAALFIASRKVLLSRLVDRNARAKHDGSVLTIISEQGGQYSAAPSLVSELWLTCEPATGR